MLIISIIMIMRIMNFTASMMLMMTMMILACIWQVCGSSVSSFKHFHSFLNYQLFQRCHHHRAHQKFSVPWHFGRILVHIKILINWRIHVLMTESWWLLNCSKLINWLYTDVIVEGASNHSQTVHQFRKKDKITTFTSATINYVIKIIRKAA